MFIPPNTMKIPVYIVDTFTETCFKGNPTAVCMLEHLGLEPNIMHEIAQELNFPVTAFILPKSESWEYPIKYFTTTGEIPACGHATLASSKVLFDITTAKQLIFNTIQGIKLGAKLQEDIIYLSYPKYQAESFFPNAAILASLGIFGYQSSVFCKELETLFLELESPQLLRDVKPDYSKLLQSTNAIKEVVITSVSDDSKYDFLLRSFCPWIGIDEDPVTGSIHSFLTPYWAQKLKKDILVAYQASKRGGVVYTKSLENHIELGGKTVVLLKGELNL